MDMDCKPNAKKTCNHEHNSKTSAAGQPAPAAASYRQLLLALLFVLIGHLKNLFQQLKDDWFQLQSMAHRNLFQQLKDDWFQIKRMVHRNLFQQLKDDWFQLQRMAHRNLFQQLKDDWFQLKRMVHRIATSPMDDYYDEGKKSEDSHMQKQKQEEAKEDNIKMVDQSLKCFCGICLDFKEESDMFRSKCKHPFCIDCIPKHVASQIQQNVLKVKCPNPSCGVELKPEYLKSILSKEIIDRWECAKYESSIAFSQKFYCPFKNCSGLLVNEPDGGKVVSSSECPYCHRLFCAQCKVPWHAEMSCKKFQKLKRNKGEKDLDMKFLELAKGKKWRKCPNCSIFVQRHGGCEHMTCRCGRNFCYRCGKNWKFGHVCK